MRLLPLAASPINPSDLSNPAVAAGTDASSPTLVIEGLIGIAEFRSTVTRLSASREI
jgi:hypothetical protein